MSSKTVKANNSATIVAANTANVSEQVPCVVTLNTQKFNGPPGLTWNENYILAFNSSKAASLFNPNKEEVEKGVKENYLIMYLYPHNTESTGCKVFNLYGTEAVKNLCDHFLT